MKLHQSQITRAAALLTAAGFSALALTGCGKPVQQAASDPAPPAVAPAPAPAARLVAPAPTNVKAPPAGVVVPPNPNAAADTIADNAKVAELAKQFEADPAAIARQNDICGPADQVLDGLYAVNHGVQTDEMRRFRVACMAKDAAQREVARRAAAAEGGVHNTSSL